eukprot:2594476-Alexandrium_andersonii.AAC.1
MDAKLHRVLIRGQVRHLRAVRDMSHLRSAPRNTAPKRERHHAAALRAHHHTNECSPSATCRLAHPAARLARKCAHSFSRRANTIHCGRVPRPARRCS